jgi:ADP-L-glycero-D-manno-heptose 6-epimerase
VILITGNNGFIGSNLHKRFKDKDKRLFLSDIDYCFKDLYFIPWDEIDEIWHMGAISDTTCTDITKINTYNIDYTLDLFEIAIHFQIPVKYASSASVYGNSPNYNRCINPLNYYAMSKSTIDRWVEDNENKFIKIQGYRFYNVYGKGEDHKKNQASPVHTFTKQAKDTGVIKLFKNSKAYMRDFIWVEDVIDCMSYDRPSGIYDLGTGVARSFERVAELIAEKYSARIEYIPFPEHLKDKYQYYTCARNDFINHKFTSIEEYLLRHTEPFAQRL